jgi:hypothetical protein
MLRTAIIVIATFAIISTGVSANQPGQAMPYDDAEAYEVYAAILPEEWPISYAKAKTVAIRTETKAYQMCLRPEQEWEEILGPAISNYQKLSQKTWLVQDRIRLETPYKLVTEDELKTIMESSGWDGFYKQYPDSGGWIELSAVGFNAKRTVAVVYMGHSCGGLCGGGSFHVLQKKDGKWVPLDWKGTSCSWAS